MLSPASIMGKATRSAGRSLSMGVLDQLMKVEELGLQF